MVDDRSVLNVYWDIERRLGETLASGKREKYHPITRADGSYIMVPFHPTTFAQGLEKAGQLIKRSNHSQPKFVDVGAGAGFKVFLAERLGFNATGIEYDKKYVEFGRNLLGLTGEDWSGTLIHADGKKVDYKEFDIIYFYRPICDQKGQRELEERILSTMRDDAIVMGIMTETLRTEMTRVNVQGEGFYADYFFHKKGCENLFKLEKVKKA